MTAWITALTDAFARLEQALFEGLVQPLLFHLGLGNVLEDAFEATGWLLVGLLQIALLLAVVGPLERWRPVEPVRDRRAVRLDILYTLIHRLGLFRVAVFFLLEPLWNLLAAQARLQGWPTWQLDQMVAPLWPGVTDSALASFLLYLLVFDLADYLIHRAQHRFDWWWALHAVHHGQRQMTMWSDNRNHLLDDLIRASLMALLARAIGVEPGQFVALVAASKLLESLSHANLRLDFGRWGRWLLVSPHFHRLHHAALLDAPPRPSGTPHSHNYAVLFPLWDGLFGTARHDLPLQPTGIRDQWPEHGGRDYGQGFWAQQWRGLARMVGWRGV